MDEDFTHVPVCASRLHLLIADYFMDEVGSENTAIEVETQANDTGDTLWIVGLQENTLSTFIHNDIGYWVRPAQLFRRDHGAYIRCYVGFSPESGKLLKLLGRSPRGGPCVWMESGPVTHILHIERMH